MGKAEIDSRAVFRVVTVAILAVALAALAALTLVEVRQTLRWLLAAVFLALALAPAVALLGRISVRGRRAPRWLAIAAVFLLSGVALGFLVLHVVPPMVGEVEQVGSQGPAYVGDFEEWARDSEEFRELNQRYDLTGTLNEQAAKLPERLGDAANELKVVTVALLRNLLSAVTVLVLAFFLLLEGPRMLDRLLRSLGGERERRWRSICDGVYAVVRGYVTVNLALALAAGLFTWGVLELLGVDIALPLAILVALLNLVPLIGLTIGGLLVAAVAALHGFPGALIIWAVAFLIYQQLQDRVVQPMLYGRAVQVNPLVAIVALLAGAQIAGILGALLAIPVAASIGVVYRGLRGADPGVESETGRAESPAGPEPASAGS